MFLDNLKFEQKKIFLGLAKKLLMIDGSFDKAEEAYLRDICAEMSLSQTDDEKVDLEQIPLSFTEKEEQRLVLLELIALAFVNVEYHDNEKDFINKIVSLFSFELSSVKEIEQLVKQFFEAQEAIINYISPQEEV